MKRTKKIIALSVCGALSGSVLAGDNARQLLWGDTHLHTSYSIDAYMTGNKTATADTAYRFAKGLPVVHPYSGVKVSLHTPLDFLVVSDHAEYLGVIQKIFTGDPALMKTEIGRRWRSMVEQGKGREAFFEALSHANSGKPSPELQHTDVRGSIWSEIVASAERHNDPGKFTAFVGWEWSSVTDGANLHRVVITDANGETGNNFLPYSLFDSDKPEDLWQWLDDESKRTGIDFIAIPHNSNISKGRMFPLTDSEGAPIDADYAKTRSRWEPVVEITQIKGDSETHPTLSPEDEFADFETFEHTIEVNKESAAEPAEKERAADYVRSALKTGLELEGKIGVNPYKFGVVGSTDSHNAMSTTEEDNFWGKMAVDSTPANTFDPTKIILPPDATGLDVSASGLAAVWATENTRESIMAAFKRREVYATTGPRIQLRFFGGFNFATADVNSSDLAATGYAKGVSMGSDLPAAQGNKAPSFLVEAVRDPNNASLDRVQIIKGWLDENGNSHEKIYNLAWSGDRKVDGKGQLPALTDTVNRATLKWDDGTGADRLVKLWRDPDFNPKQKAFYYVRALQIPTPRHTLYDAVALDVRHPDSHPETIQERAYSSAIWYTPL